MTHRKSQRVMCSCYMCGWRDEVNKAVSSEDSEGWEYPSYIVHDCPVCGAPIEDYYGQPDSVFWFKEMAPADPFSDWLKELSDYAESFGDKYIIIFDDLENKRYWLEFYNDGFSAKHAYIHNLLDVIVKDIKQNLREE